jgi:hypothetical protein
VRCIFCFLNVQVHENAYHSEFHHCFSLTSNASGANLTQVETRLLGIDVIVGSQGDSCDAVCKSRGQLCVMNKLSLLNQCDVMKRYMNCKGSCLASAGADQPAEVVEDAPRDLVFHLFFFLFYAPFKFLNPQWNNLFTLLLLTQFLNLVHKLSDSICVCLFSWSAVSRRVFVYPDTIIAFLWRFTPTHPTTLPMCLEASQY